MEHGRPREARVDYELVGANISLGLGKCWRFAPKIKVYVPRCGTPSPSAFRARCIPRLGNETKSLITPSRVRRLAHSTEKLAEHFGHGPVLNILQTPSKLTVQVFQGRKLTIDSRYCPSCTLSRARVTRDANWAPELLRHHTPFGDDEGYRNSASPGGFIDRSGILCTYNPRIIKNRKTRC